MLVIEHSLPLSHYGNSTPSCSNPLMASRYTYKTWQTLLLWVSSLPPTGASHPPIPSSFSSSKAPPTQFGHLGFQTVSCDPHPKAVYTASVFLPGNLGFSADSITCLPPLSLCATLGWGLCLLSLCMCLACHRHSNICTVYEPTYLPVIPEK